MQSSILIVEDDPITRKLIVDFMRNQGRSTAVAESAEEAVHSFRLARTGIVLLDIMLPDRDGLSLIGELRAIEPTVGIILVSSKGELLDRVLGLEMGADDYLPKPFELPELVARIKALERRNRLITAAPPAQFECGEARIDFARRVVEYRDGAAEPLTDGEYRILEALFRARGAVVRRERLLLLLRKDNIPAAPRSLDVIIRRLRTKLRAPADRTPILTVHGVGYRLDTSPLNQASGTSHALLPQDGI